MSNLLDLSFPHPRDCPSFSDIQLCKAIIQDFDRTIERLRSNRRPNLTRIRELGEKRANYLSYIAPFRRLPAEVLGEIFYFSVKIYAKNIWVLCRVCGRFRDIILEMGGIWSRIRFPRKRPERYVWNYERYIFEVRL
jgi:hypothetical protein